MEAIQPASRSASRETGLSGNYAPRLRVSSERDALRNGALGRGLEENQSPAAIPKAFQGMLKTTTETGDIGMFSIKPSRIPQSLNSPRRIGGAYTGNFQQPRQSQPYGVPTVDDRRRLPSYARDASSEVISMYETASQKSGSRGFEDPDYRSCSMTQTSSYSSYTLSNHRSYASLRSQQDGNGLLQRPRSPFAYPTRLKRPGFRPSSPALTDGGGVDYSRRAEIERKPPGTGHNTSSPSSLYAQKRKPPPIALRPDANRSTPSLLNHHSPPRRSVSSHVRQSNGSQLNEWPRRNGPTSVNTSPARSTFSLASSMNIYATTAPVSTTTTPGKLHPPSPAYYDYTEEFDFDDYNQPEPVALGPPPPFHIEKSIPEDRPMSPNKVSAPLHEPRSPDTSVRGVLDYPSSVTSILRKSFEESHNFSKATNDTSISSVAQQSIITQVVDQQSESKAADARRDTKVIRLSGLGYGAQELSTHVEEVFGLPSSPSFEIEVSNNSVQSELNRKSSDSLAIGHDVADTETQSARTSAYSLNTNLPNFPLPPEHQYPQSTKGGPVVIHMAAETCEDKPSSGDPSKLPQSSGCNQNPERNEVGDLNEPHIHGLTQQRHRSIGLDSVDTGLTELAELITSLEGTNNRARSPPDMSLGLDPQRKTLMISPTIPNEVVLCNVPLDHTTHTQVPLKQAGNKNGPIIGSLPNWKRKQHNRCRVDLGPPILPDDDVPNFSHQIPRKLMSRSESPMLAPKPISPVRQLKLKNSVPQLMKALPALPPDPPIRAVSPPNHLTSSNTELPCQFSPLLPESRPTPAQETTEAQPKSQVHGTPDKALPKHSKEEGNPCSLSPQINIMEKKVEQERLGSPPPLPKLKLKPRISGVRPLSPPNSRPWNLEESYPWSESQNLNVGLPSLVQDDKTKGFKPPKFKLKVTRASNSTQGTIRINRDSAESKPLTGLRNPKDLFTPTSGLDNIFRQVSRHLSSRKTSANSIHALSESSSTPSSIPISNQIFENESSIADSSPQATSSTSPGALSPSEAQSFFSDDSSHMQGRHRLRKRLSNFRARIAVPYTSRGGAKSHDDITWRGRTGAEAPTPSAVRSVPNLHVRRAATVADSRRIFVEKVQGQKLREKVRGWLRDARAAITARMRPRSSSDERGDDEVAQLTAVV